jgi:dUTP pyrophosphatase
MVNKLKIKKVSDKAKIPEYKTSGSSGMDTFSTEKVTLYPCSITAVSTGLAFNIPEGYELQVRPRSGLALKNGITVLNSPGTIDSDYTGIVKVILINLGKDKFQIEIGDRIAQLVLCPVIKAEFEIVDNLEITERSDGGFGSTGIK